MRLIDADAAKEWFKGGRLHMFSDDVLNRIDHTPTIDAVPVVRCKECKQSAWRQSPFGVRTFTCQLLCADIKPDDFCSYGERKDGEG